MNNNLLKLMVASINEDDCPVSYNVISEALHSLDSAGEGDLERFKMGYIRKTLTEKELKFMEWHIRSCKICLNDLLSKAKIYSFFKITDKIAGEFLEKAKELNKKGYYKEAIECYQEALELKPDDIKCLGLLAKSYIDNGERSKGEEIIKKMKSMSPKDITGDLDLTMGGKSEKITESSEEQPPETSSESKSSDFSTKAQSEEGQEIEQLLPSVEEDEDFKGSESSSIDISTAHEVDVSKQSELENNQGFHNNIIEDLIKKMIHEPAVAIEKKEKSSKERKEKNTKVKDASLPSNLEISSPDDDPDGSTN